MADSHASSNRGGMRLYEYHLSFEAPMMVYRSKTFCVFARDEADAMRRAGPLVDRALDRWGDALPDKGWQTWIP